MKIATLTPTRGNSRALFFHNTLRLINSQTVKPDIIEVVDDAPSGTLPDITRRYRLGVERCISKGADIIFFIEDDDWYSSTYIERMIEAWEKAGKPHLFGNARTIYYNVLSEKYLDMNTGGRSSMMCSMVYRPEVFTQWPDDHYSYTDIFIWRTLKSKATANFQEVISCGIKHGVGLCGGGGHPQDWRGYNKDDKGKIFLKTFVDKKSLDLYADLPQRLKYSYEKIQLHRDPFLSIITRCYVGRRPQGFAKNQESVAMQSSVDFEQLLIKDSFGLGRHEANRAFSYVSDMIAGKYVYLLDDDDFLVNENFVREIKACAKSNDFPPAIFFKMKILTGDGDEIYPKPDAWRTESFGASQRGRIGGSCFVVRKDIFDKHIKLFDRPALGDWNFLNSLFHGEDASRFVWLDKMMAETFKVSRGATE